MEKFEKFMLDLILSVAITAGVYTILTAPHLCLIFFGFGFAYSPGGSIASGIASGIIGHLIADKLKI